MIRALTILFSLTLSLSAGEFRFGTQMLTVPDGFVVELVAAPPLVDRPIEASFDEQGRLYVTDVTGTNDKVEKQLADHPHRVLRLEDTDGDGKFDKRTVFAKDLGFPEGCLWHDGSLYVAAPPQIWKFTDTDGDGVADQREVWFDGKTLGHCANDLHGPYAGPDGWIYWCKGAFAEQTYTLADGREFKTKASHIFRRRPEGGPIEPVLTGGMDNPVGLAFSAAGERFLSSTFFQNPANGQRDGLIHAIYGGVYGKQHAVLDSHVRTGPDLMPVLTHLGPAAACGLTRAESDVLGFRDQLFATSFNLKRVSRHELVPDGASFTTRDHDFVVSDSTDFHPTDVFEDADGSMLIIDTGGWYKICCPTSQLQKSDVLGAIYRVRRQGAPKIVDARGLALDWAKPSPAELIKRLSDSRPAVRARAQAALGKSGDAAIPPLSAFLKQSNDTQARLEAVWALTQNPAPAAREAVRAALADSDGSVQQAALHSVSVWRDRGATTIVTELLGAKSPAVRRVAAEALGRIGGENSTAPLLRATSDGDRALDHSLTYALIELSRADEVRLALARSEPEARRRALVALDQMPGAQLKAADVVPFLSSENQPLRETARWIASRHPEWSGEIVAWLRDARAKNSIALADTETLLLALASSTAAQELVTAWADGGQSAELQLLSLHVIARAVVTKTPPAWFDRIAAAIDGSAPEIRLAAIDAARSMRDRKVASPELSAALSRLAAQASASPEDRVAALAALADPLKAVDTGTFDLLKGRFAPGQPMLARRAAAALLRRLPVSDEQWKALAQSATGLELSALADLLAVFERCANESAGRALLASLHAAKGVANLPADALRKAFTKLPEPMREEAAQLSASQGGDVNKQRTRLDELAAYLKNGDVRRGQALLRSAKTACVSCHAAGYVGGKLGPDLTRIGKIRTERDLLEAIVYPSVSFVRSYEPTLVHTKSGGEINGILREENTSEVVLGIGPGVDFRVPRADVQSVDPGTMSLMPQGYDGILTPEEIADLVTFLKASM